MGERDGVGERGVAVGRLRTGLRRTGLLRTVELVAGARRRLTDALDRRRLAIGLGAGAAATALVATTIGLLTGRLVGAEDNADGYRLFCGAGLLPRTVDRFAYWKGGVVTDFTVGEPSCGMSVPSSASLVLRAASLGADTVDLVAVAWWYALLVGVVVGLAAWAASADGPWRAAVLVVPVAPLALAAFSRFFLSTYAEPAGLLGTVAVACGLATLLVTTQRRARSVALGLVAVGGAVAATAKVGYLPVVLVAAAVVVTVLVRDRRRPRPAVVVGVVLLAAVAVALPAAGAVHFQQKIYEGANVHDVVFTLALIELGPDGPADLGLPAEAAALAGTGFFNGPPRPTADWWVRAIRDRPAVLRSDAVAALVDHPGALLRAVGVGLQATTRADLPYLASDVADPTRPSATAGDTGWSGARQPDLRAVLDDAAQPSWLPTAVVLAAVGAALSALAWRRRAPAVARWCLAAGIAAVTGVGLVATALWGDGYFEVFKHVWLAAYVLLLAVSCLVGALGALAVRVVTRRA